MAEPNDDDYIIPNLSDLEDHTTRRHHDVSLLCPEESGSLVSGSWCVVDSSEASPGNISNNNTSKDPSDKSTETSLNLTRPDTLSLTKSGTSYTSFKPTDSTAPLLTHHDTNKLYQSRKPENQPQSALERFLAQDFSEGNTTLSKGQGHFREPMLPVTSPKDCPEPSLPAWEQTRRITTLRNSRDQVTERWHAPGLFLHDKPLENYYRLLLRRRAVQTAYHTRNTAASGGKPPDAEWRWCGVDECSKDACRYIDPKPADRTILVTTDLEGDCNVLKELIVAFVGASLDHNVFISFATSPPAMLALAEYLSSVVDGKGVLTKCFWIEGILDMAANKFKREECAKSSMHTGFPSPSQHLRRNTDRHDELSFYQHEWETDTARDLMFRVIVRLEAWRKRQVAEGYPWEWTTATAAHAYKTIISTYRQAYSQGYLVLKKVGPKVQDKAWTLWWDRCRPWTDCKGPLLAEFEAADMEARNKAKREHGWSGFPPDAHSYEGVGRYKPPWWPSRPRALGVDLSLEH